MALPHMAFVGGYVGLKLVFPSFVKWMAYDTYSTALLSIWYPLFMTLSWVHDARRNKRTKDRPVSARVRVLASSDDNTPSHRRHTTASKNLQDRKGKRVSGVFSRTNPPKPETPNVRGQKQKAACPAVIPEGDKPEAATRFWLRYWVAFAMAQSLGTLGAMVPVFGTFVAQHPFVLHVCSELKLLFFIWLFTMENLIGAAVVEEDALMAKAMPLALIHEHITPLLLEFEAVVAEAVSQTTWMTLVHSKAQRILELVVMLKMISETRKDWLLHILEEGRTLLLPSLSLFMPSFITSWGVAYVKFIVPSAKASRVLRAKKNHDSQEMELLYLQYWIIHCLASSVVAYFSTILWWIPFSTHAIFLMWCHLSFPKSIVQTYDVLEMELAAFGLLPGESNIQIHETKTAKVLQAVYSRLPSAAEDESGAVADIDPMTERRQDSSSTGLEQAVHVDSQLSHVEVSIRNTGCQSEDSQDTIDDDNGNHISTDENDPPEGPDDIGTTANKKNSSAKHLKASSADEKDDNDFFHPIKQSESTFTASTGSTLMSQDLGSAGSGSMNSASAARDSTHSVRRSARQRGKSSRS